MAKKPYYITTAIAYTSGKPHIGNTYEVVLADSIARYKRFLGYDVRFQTGTDEHGQKIELKAAEAGVTPKEFVDKTAGEIKRIWDLMNTSYDKFIRTTDEDHEKQVQKIFKKLYEKGDIYNVHTDDILPDSLRNRPYKVSTEFHYITKDTLANGNNINKSEKTGKMEVEVTNFDMLNSKPLIVLDGKEYTGSLNYIKPGDINSINVYKPGSDVANAYGEKGKNGVLKIFTKASKDNVLYVVDGKPATSQEVKDIAPSKISNIVVLKRGSKAAMDYGEVGKTHDVCIIKTK